MERFRGANDFLEHGCRGDFFTQGDGLFVKVLTRTVVVVRLLTEYAIDRLSDSIRDQRKKSHLLIRTRTGSFTSEKHRSKPPVCGPNGNRTTGLEAALAQQPLRA
jgi:hypothetical protein